MFNALYDFYINTLLTYEDAYWLSDINIQVFSVNFDLGEYLAFIFTLISIVIIFVLCCLFVYKIIKLVGNLIR